LQSFLFVTPSAVEGLFLKQKRISTANEIHRIQIKNINQ